MRTIAIINQKGGCGKTTSAINLAGVFSRAGLRTLLVDLDPQAHCAAGLAIPEQRIDVHIGDALTASDEKPIDWTRLLWRVSRNLDLAPSTVRLAGLEAARGALSTIEHPERRLLSVLSRLADQYDFCLLDCPPAIGLLTYNALVACTEVLIPVETAFFSLQGAAKQVSTIKALGKRLGVSPPYRMLPTLHNPESMLSRDLLAELQRRFEGRVSPVVVRFDQHLREAVSFGQPVVEYAPHSTGAEDYIALGRWLIDSDEARRARQGDDGARKPQNGAVTVRDGVSETFLAGGAGGAGGSNPGSTAPAQNGPTSAVSDAMTRTRAADLADRAARLVQRADSIVLPPPSLSDFVRGGREVEGMRELYGARQTSQGVLFVQPGGPGRRISIAGTFNNWSADATVMRHNDQLGVYEACLQLPPGRFLYRLVVDGQWVADQHNPFSEPNPFGGINSVLEVLPLAQPISA